MAVLWQKSFDQLATADLATYGVVYGGATVETSGLVGNRLGIGTSQGWYVLLPSAPASVWVQLHYLCPSSSGSIIGFGSSDGYFKLTLWQVQGVIFAYRPNNLSAFNTNAVNGGTDTLLGKTTLPCLTNGAWASIEAEVTISNTVGVVKVWVNGALVLDLSGQNTQPASGLANVGVVGFGGATYRDNIVIGDFTGANNGHPGEVRVDCMMPDANGTDSTMSRSTGSDDYPLVDEVGASAGTSDYWYADAIGEKTSVNVAALTNAGGTIVAVQCTVYATKNEAGPCGFKIYVLRSGTRYYSDEFFPSFGSWAFFTKVWDQDPSTSAAWTESNFNGAEFGVERTT